MAPRSRFTSGNTCGCRMSWTYHWADMVPRSNTRCDHVLLAMALHTATPAVGTVCHYDLLQSSFLVRGTTPNGQVDGRQGSARNGCRDPKYLSDRRLRMVRKDTGAPSEGATCAWMAADEKQLALCLHFLRCGGLLDDWSVEGVLSLVFV
ncbi:uncharacterized protein TNCV_3484891 [Trichonephila clavipes]|nr:uncharacterized protein TNCV_3484891 [Trichonephila clavipes]